MQWFLSTSLTPLAISIVEQGILLQFHSNLTWTDFNGREIFWPDQVEVKYEDKRSGFHSVSILVYLTRTLDSARKDEASYELS